LTNDTSIQIQRENLGTNIDYTCSNCKKVQIPKAYASVLFEKLGNSRNKMCILNYIIHSNTSLTHV